jgi:mannosyltransferase
MLRSGFGGRRETVRRKTGAALRRLAATTKGLVGARKRVSAGSGSESESGSGLPSVVALGIVLVAAVLRLSRLGDESFWLDEAFTWVFVTEKYTAVELLTILPSEDVHPPLYYLLMDGWVAVAGTSEAVMRLPSALFGIATVWLTYVVGAKLFDEWAGVGAAAVVGVSTFHLYYSQEARMYTLLVLLTLASYYFFVDLADGGATDRWTVPGYVLTSVLLLYTHVYGIFIVLAQNAYLVPRLLLAGREWPVIGRASATGTSLRGWLSVQSVVALLAAPWLLTLFTRFPTISEGGCASITWIPEPCLSMVRKTIIRYFFYCGSADIYGFGIAGSPLCNVVYGGLTALALVLAVGGAVGIGVKRSGKHDPTGPKTLMVLLWFLTPIVVPFVLSQVITPFLVTRYTIVASLPLFLLLGKGVQTLRPLVPAGGRLLIVVLLVVGLAAPLPTYYEEDQKRQWRGAVETVESTASDDALVLVSEPHVVAPYWYYARDSDRTIIGINDTTTRAEVRAAVGDHDSVWLVLSRAKKEELAAHLRSLGYEAVESHRYQGVRVHSFVRKGN